MISGIAYLYYNSTQPLATPFGGFYDDQSARVKSRIAPVLALDYSKSQTIASLEKVPRYLVYNSQTGKVYYSKNPDELFTPASFTKLVSTEVVLDLVSPDTKVTATKESIDKVPTILGLKEGEKFTVAELLRGAIATSANDAAQTLADGAATANKLTSKDFIHLMNVKADLMGMKNSHFANPDGLDDQTQFSTLNDLAIAVNNVQKNYPEIIAAGASDNQDILTDTEHGHYYLPNWNGLMGVYPGVTGLKIAYTEGAGYSSITTASISGIPVVAIVSGTNSLMERDLAVSNLLDAAFMAEKIPPKKITKYQINKRYKIWGDLAKKIKAELAALKTTNATSSSNTIPDGL